MKVYLVVLNWNGKDFIEDCLDSLQKQTYSSEIIVVDNGSSDGSLETVEQKYPDIYLLKEPKNRGFAGGVNIGIKHAMRKGADAVALFNNDAIADKEWLAELVKTMENKPGTGIVTSKLMRSNKKHFDSTGDFYSTRGMPFPRGRNRVDKGQYDEPGNVFGASGGASLYRCSALKEIGLFDERFFAYYEDVDISFRTQLAGWRVYYQPKAVAYHRLSGTSSKLGNFAHFHSNKNFYFLYLKNMPGRLFIKFLPLFLYQALRSAASSIIHLRILSYLKALFFVIVYLPAVLLARRKIQKSRKVSVDYIESLLYHSKPPVIPKL
ncbi:MAG TPA: glycosyltransferase family 2 protein [Candidatus Saccharimonadales bacterium]|nr:glycosyltransferase family 2 protein [Candidatus Saccharimonadales bacterium]